MQLVTGDEDWEKKARHRPELRTVRLSANFGLELPRPTSAFGVAALVPPCEVATVLHVILDVGFPVWD
jgi:hypothetical protein